MKVVKTDNSKNIMTLSELEALSQFETSERPGQVVFHPRLGPASPAPHCVVLPEGLTRIAVTYLDGEHWVENGQWHRRDDDGTVTPIDDVLERSWQAAMAVRSRLNKERGINAYVVAVAAFTGMEPDESITAAAAGRGTRVLFGMDDHMERLTALLGEQDLQHPLKARYIPDDVAVLSPQGDAADGAPETASLDVGDGRVKVQVDTVNVDTLHVHLHITIVVDPNGGVSSWSAQG